MTAYVNYNVLLQSSTSSDEGIQDDFSQSGIQHSIILRSQRYEIFEVQYHMDLVELTAIWALYDAGPRDSYTGFEYLETSPLSLYTVKFQHRPRIIANLGDNTFYVAVRLRGIPE